MRGVDNASARWVKCSGGTRSSCVSCHLCEIGAKCCLLWLMQGRSRVPAAFFRTDLAKAQDPQVSRRAESQARVVAPRKRRAASNDRSTDRGSPTYLSRAFPGAVAEGSCSLLLVNSATTMVLSSRCFAHKCSPRSASIHLEPQNVKSTSRGRRRDRGPVRESLSHSSKGGREKRRPDIAWIFCLEFVSFSSRRQRAERKLFWRQCARSHLSGTKSFALVKASSDRQGTTRRKVVNAVPASNFSPFFMVRSS